MRKLLSHKLVRDGLASYGFTASILVVNLLTGVLMARTLGASGRGELTAITTLVQVLMFLFSVGCSRALAYHQARQPEDAAGLIGTWLVLILPLSVVAIAVGELVLPAAFAGQAESTIELARIYLLTLIPTLLAEPLFGVMLGEQDFIYWNVLRFAQPVLTALAYVVLWQLGE